MELKTVKVEIPEGANVVIGHTHFIKTAEDLYELLATSVPGMKFGLAFCEASQDCLIRSEGNDPQLKKKAEENAQNIACGHSFVILIKEAFPINIMHALKACAEVVGIYCATANPVEVIIAETEQGRGILGVVDGFPPKGIETPKHVKERKEFLRKIGYKLG